MSRIRRLRGGSRGPLDREAQRSRWLRPAGRPGLLKLVAKAGALAAALAVALLVAGVAASSLYDQFGFHPERNARSWAALASGYTDSALCRTCHAVESTRLAGAKHSGIACEACHGPLAGHGSTEAATVAAVPSPPAGLCVSCHERVIGRPADVPQVVLATHYGPGACLACHDAHAASATRPPDVSHPLTADLPTCSTCHNAVGLKALPSDHRQYPDGVCLLCHASDRGLEGGSR